MNRDTYRLAEEHSLQEECRQYYRGSNQQSELSPITAEPAGKGMKEGEDDQEARGHADPRGRRRIRGAQRLPHGGPIVITSKSHAFFSPAVSCRILLPKPSCAH